MADRGAAARRALSRSTGLIAIDPSGPTAADLHPDACLGDAPHLQALYEPTPRLDLKPRPILQRMPALTWRDRLRRVALLASAAVLVNGGLGIAFFLLLSFRDAELPREVEIPIEVITEPPKEPAKPTGAGASQAGGKAGGSPSAGVQQAQSVSPTPQTQQPQGQTPPPPPPDEPKPAPPKPPQPAAAPPASKAGPPSAPPQQASSGPKLVAAQPDATRAATQTRENKTANLQPDEHQTDAATREAKPVSTPQTLTTADPKASFAVPVPVEAKPAAAARPTPPTIAKTPSAADMLAAALPMDTSAMPSSFRAVLAGNNAAQLKAAYAGVVQGRLTQAQPDIVDTAYSQHLKGAVSVLFTLDASGNLADVSIVQSSGDPRLDALALHWIQVAAPFPPPPPDAEHTFKKALLFGN
ncbi:MAG: TonB family protein [Janthinobacterium lividum]